MCFCDKPCMRAWDGRLLYLWVSWGKMPKCRVPASLYLEHLRLEDSGWEVSVKTSKRCQNHVNRVFLVFDRQFFLALAEQSFFFYFSSLSWLASAHVKFAFFVSPFCTFSTT